MAAITVSAHENLLKALQSDGHYLPALCGGKGSCGKCAVRIISGSVPISAADSARFTPMELDKGWRLACTARPTEKITAEIPDSGEENFSAVDNFSLDSRLPTPDSRLPLPDSPLPAPHSPYSIAIDIGTTTLGFALVDCTSGKTSARYSTVNRQREYGADVITRIQSANSGNLQQLCQIIRTQISEGIAAVCAEAAISAGKIGCIAIAGNTTMLHILLNLSCSTLGQAPFTPVTLDMAAVPYRDIFSGDLDCDVVILPGISTYVGADITAGIYFTGLHESAAPAVLIDIGTNGEIALVHNGKILCTATAAGPAFEGGNILWGTGSVPGAISHAQFNGNAFKVSTIGNRPPLGICGSGVIDIVHQGLKNNLIESSGRFAGEQGGGLFLAGAPDGRDIIFCQKDVRELQLAKSAIRSGLDALLNNAGLVYEDIQALYISGGFGYHLDMESALGIGLIPAPLAPKVSLVGNSALGGAAKFLCAADSGAELKRITGRAAEFNLPDDEYFSESFIANINFF